MFLVQFNKGEKMQLQSVVCLSIILRMIFRAQRRQETMKKIAFLKTKHEILIA